MKTALLTGITGQDGSFLAELLLDEGYMVHGLVRRSATPNLSNIKHLVGHERLVLHYGDLTDDATIFHVLRQTRPDEIYNLAAQSHVRVSFDTPIYTADVDGLGVTRILEAMRSLNMFPTSKFYQASTSELYGKIQDPIQNENTPFYPRSPYGVAKQYAFWMVKNYREAYNLFGCNGILFNHESPRRGEEFVTRKITKQVGEIARGERQVLELGNYDSERDWGHAKDYVKAMYLMLQYDKADDYVVATGEKHSVREFIEIAFTAAGLPLTWHGSGVNEIGKHGNDVLVKVNPQFYRPTEVDVLIGDSSKARTVLGWKPEYSFEDLVQEMLRRDFMSNQGYKHYFTISTNLSKSKVFEIKKKVSELCVTKFNLDKTLSNLSWPDFLFEANSESAFLILIKDNLKLNFNELFNDLQMIWPATIQIPNPPTTYPKREDIIT